MLILAGAGAGKTKTLTYRILHLIKQGVTPSSILAITFTNKAAKEMRERVFALLDQDKSLNAPVNMVGGAMDTASGANGANNSYRTERPFISTFHALGVHIIRENATRLGLTKHFSIFDRSDSRRAVKNALEEIGLDPKQYEPNVLLSIISKEKGNGVNMAKFGETIGNEYMREVIFKVWQKYDATLRKEKALDFDDLLLKTMELLQIPEINKHYSSVWKYIHIDEYQDTNKVQYSIAKLIAGDLRNGDTYGNICVVGDVDQNIYSWRGADIKNMMSFEKDFPGAHMVILEENYRSTQTILSVANHIIKKNKNRFEKNLFTKQGAGEKVYLYQAFDENDEARFVADKSAELIKSGVNADEIAVLYRANFQSRALEEAMLAKDIAYQVLGVKFFERKEVKDVLSYIRAALNRDSISDLQRIINVPARGIGKVTTVKIFSGMADTLSPAHKEKWQSFSAMLDDIASKAQPEKTSELVKYVVRRSGLEAAFKEGGTDEDLERLENVKELATLATKYDFMMPGDGVMKLLEDASLASDQDEMNEDKKAVRLMTVHASKGLEFEYVFITGLEQDLFPHKAMESKSSKRDEEEERRLFYVALTRAKKRIFISHASMRTIFGSRQVTVPSEFVFDIPEEHIEESGGGRYGSDDGIDLSAPKRKFIYFD